MRIVCKIFLEYLISWPPCFPIVVWMPIIILQLRTSSSLIEVKKIFSQMKSHPAAVDVPARWAEVREARRDMPELSDFLKIQPDKSPAVEELVQVAPKKVQFDQWSRQYFASRQNMCTLLQPYLLVPLWLVNVAAASCCAVALFHTLVTLPGSSG